MNHPSSHFPLCNIVDIVTGFWSVTACIPGPDLNLKPKKMDWQKSKKVKKSMRWRFSGLYCFLTLKRQDFAKKVYLKNGVPTMFLIRAGYETGQKLFQSRNRNHIRNKYSSFGPQQWMMELFSLEALAGTILKAWEYRTLSYSLVVNRDPLLLYIKQH